MKKWKIWVGLTVIFFSGFVVGTVSTVVVVKRKLIDHQHRTPEVATEQMLSRMERGFRLSAAQLEAIRSPILSMNQSFHALKRRVTPEAFVILDNTVMQVRPHLNDEQKIKFEEKLQELRKRHADREERNEAG